MTDDWGNAVHPVANDDTRKLAAENAQLKDQALRYAAEAEKLPKGDKLAAALSGASGKMERAIVNLRDNKLADNNPDALLRVDD